MQQIATDRQLAHAAEGNGDTVADHFLIPAFPINRYYVPTMRQALFPGMRGTNTM